MAKDQLFGTLAVILHADVADSTALVRQNERLAHERIQTTFHRFGDTITKYHGHVRELRGDALLAEFERASDAVTAALAFQSGQSDYIAQIEDEIKPEVRVGIALGEVVIADDTITGAGVVLAQRLEQLAERGGVVIQGAIYETIPERFPFEYKNLGEHQVKGFDEPIRVYQVMPGEGNIIPPPQEIKRYEVSGKPSIKIASITAVVAVAALVTLFWIKPWETDVDPASVERMVLPLPDKPSIAVLAFINLSGDPDKAFLSDGISENIITALSRFSQLFVIARQSSFSYKDKLVTVKQVSEELGVRYVLEGSVQLSGDKVRVTAQLINAIEGNHVWAEKYDRDLEEIFSVQDEITSNIVATLKSNIDLSEYERVKNKAPKSLNAYENFALASLYWFKYTKEDNQRALEYYEKARELDPDWAEAYRGIAWVHINGYRWGWSGTLSRERSLELAFQNARKGVELEPFNHRLHQTLAEVLIQAGRLDEASAEYSQAIQLNPNDASVLAGATATLIFTGRSAQAVEQLKRAIRMNPYHPVWYLWNLGFAQYFIEDYEGAVESFNQMKKMPNLARRQLAAVYVGLGKIDEAKAVIAEFLKIDPDYSIAKLRLNFKGKFSDPKDLDRLIADLRTAGLPENAPLTLPDKLSIAVLPFSNLSVDPKQEYFSDGLTEDLITDLSRLPSLAVISRSSTTGYKGRQVNVREVGEALGVRYVIEGSVRREGNQVRINVQLIDATTDSQVWADRYDGILDDIFKLQDRVLGQIVEAMSLKLSEQDRRRLSARGTHSIAAHELYLRGLFEESKFTREGNREAVLRYEQALSIDPDYPLPYSRLSQILQYNIRSGWTEDIHADLALAVDLAEKAISLDPDNPMLHWILSRALSRIHAPGMLQRGIEAMERAIELDPYFADAYAFLGNLYTGSGRIQEGLRSIETAMKLNPRYPFWYLFMRAMNRYFVEDYEAAIADLEAAAQRNPNAQFLRWWLAISYAGAGNMDDAEWQIDELFGIGFEGNIESITKTQPIQHPPYLEKYTAALRQVGIPD